MVDGPAEVPQGDARSRQACQLRDSTHLSTGSYLQHSATISIRLIRTLRKATGSLWPANPKWPFVRGAPGCALAVERLLAGLGQVGVDNLEAVEVNLRRGRRRRPFPGSSTRRPAADTPVQRAPGRRRCRGLVRLQIRIMLRRVVEHLDFDARRRPGRRRPRACESPGRCCRPAAA